MNQQKQEIKMLYEIKNRWNDSVLFSLECGSLKMCVEAAVLAEVSLRGANLRYADLRYADLRGADLRYADLRGSDLRGSNLSDADLSAFRDDIWAVLAAAPAEAKAVRSALLAGKINGSCYEGDCCCLVGTLGKSRGCKYNEIPGLVPDSSRLAEVWFFGINEGDTPETNPMCKQAYEWVNEWINEWITRMEAAFAGDNQ